MNPKISFTLVGLFVLLLSAGLVITVVWISASATARNYDTYVTYMYESVSGLNQGAPVTYRGVEVGYVREIALDQNRPDRVRLMLAIEEGTPIKEDTTAVLVMQGITGLAKMELTGGSIESPRLVARPGARYPEIESGASLLVRIDQAITTLTGSLDATIEQLNIVASRVADLLDERNRTNIAATLEHIEVLSGALADQSESLGSSLANVDRVLRNSAQASERFPAILDQAERGLHAFGDTADNVNRAVLAFEDTAQTITSAVGGIEELIAELRVDLRAFTQNTPAQVDALAAELFRLSHNLQVLTHDLVRDPNMLFFGRPSPRAGPGEDD
jgi:phospholipid/cholesterol/gamma-HCH transport system substrate-binding protein